MRRREFIAWLGSAAAWPVVARAQRPTKLPTIGVLGPNTQSYWAPWLPPFLRRLGDLGWIDGRNVAIEYRWAEGRGERAAEIAAEFVRLKVDVIFTAGGDVPIAKQATSVIPIVFALANDPVESGYVASLPRPGGNVTGLSLQQNDTAGKRLQLIREILPRLRRVATLAQLANPSNVLEADHVRAAARTLGIEVTTWDVRRAEDIAPAIEALKSRAQALYVCNEPFLNGNKDRISTLALSARLPAVYSTPETAGAAGLMSYGANYPDLFRRAADVVDKILRGTKPADIPIEQATKFDLVINLKTAKALGLTIPETLLATADEVIQ
jgi:putative ABC transport system substrate-binding protein